MVLGGGSVNGNGDFRQDDPSRGGGGPYGGGGPSQFDGFAPPPPPHHHSSFHHHHHHGHGHGHPGDLPPVPEEGESRMPPHEMMRGDGEEMQMTRDGNVGTTTAGPPPRGEDGGPPSTVRIPPSPLRGDELSTSPGSIQRTHSAYSATTSSTNGTTASMKRSFWHHSRPGEDVGPAGGGFEGTILPPEFMPPKRSKVSSASSTTSRQSREYYVVARTPTTGGQDDEQQKEFVPPPPAAAVAAASQRSDENEEGTSPLPGSENAGSSATGNRSNTNSASNKGGWINSNRSTSWDARDDYYRRGDPRVGHSQSWSSRSPPTREGPMASPHWLEAPYMPSPRSRYGMLDVGVAMPYDAAAMTMSRQNSWMSASSHSSLSGGPWVMHGHYRQPSADYPWSGPPDALLGSGPPQQSRDDHRGSRSGGNIQGRDRFDDRTGYPVQNNVYQQQYGYYPTEEEHAETPAVSTSRGQSATKSTKKTKATKSVQSTTSTSTPRILPAGKEGPIQLLALPEDEVSLSETLCIVRRNIEIFTATLEDVEAPAPGRKHAVTVGQVGLRCIHCRHTTRSSDRVKRAVCYPSSIKRIYRTVIDMKLDHFLHCKFVPESLKETLNALKATNTRSTGTTMQYFIRAATGMGMEDGANGVRFVGGSAPSSAALSPAPMVSPSPKTKKTKNATAPSKAVTKTLLKQKPSMGSEGANASGQTSPQINRTASMASDGTPIPLSPQSPPNEMHSPTGEFFTGEVSLALPEDKMSLSPLRCFLREQVCAFSATEEDIAVRTPTTFSVTVGQVGIGCIHCLHQPSKSRLNRAVCFPFSVNRIYQSVADIQRFHLSECKLVPPDVKAKFEELSSLSSKGSKGLATRQYWITSAKKIGLVDTSNGIRFSRDPNSFGEKAVSLDILAQVASHVTTVNRPLVAPEDKETIAEFLYVVMDQLQACRFTEADRNKRRLKDVGCIGVECKHCAGQVDGRKFFWSSVNAVESNFVSVHTHMMECRHVPNELKDELARLKKLRKEQTTALKTGSQKAFFARVWKRLHTESEDEKASMQLSPMNSDDSNDQAWLSRSVELSPKSPDSQEHLKSVTNDMAIVSV
mmetsp:Transcript_49080/g.118915  ORF Transcript_49080/g.118915 Transcript_49080/m.118915 type:complete len:1089 (-) Transcript_49080:172-3438(-)